MKQAGQLFLVIIGFVLFPASLQRMDFRILNSALSIKQNPSSPAYAAFVDSVAQWEQTTPSKIEQPVSVEETLGAGSEESLALFNYFVRQQVVPIQLAQKKSDSQDYIPLQGMRVSRQALVAQTQHSSSSNLSVLGQDEIQVAQVSVEPRLYSRQGELLPLPVRKQLLSDFYKEQDFSAPTWQEKAQELVQAAQQKLNDHQNQTSMVIMAGTRENPSPILVAKPEPKPTLPNNKKSEKSSPPPVSSPAQSKPMSDSVNENPSRQTGPFVPDERKYFTIRGKVSLSDGLVHFDMTNLRVLHVDEGELVSEVFVSVHDGTYEIVVDHLSGYLVAELSNLQGQVLGAAEVDLFQFDGVPYNQLVIPHVNFYVREKPQGVEVRLLAPESTAKKPVDLKQGQVVVEALGRSLIQEQNLYKDSYFSPRSSFILRASQLSEERGNKWGSLAVGVVGSRQTVRVFGDQQIQSLLKAQLGEEDSKSDLGGIVWGRVTKNGDPVKGVTVELLGEVNRPIYSSQRLLNQLAPKNPKPSSEGSGTQEEGLFAFVDVVPGVQVVKATLNGKPLPVEVVPVEEGNTSYVELRVVESRRANIRVFDGLDRNQNLSAEFSLVGVNKLNYVRPDLPQALEFPGQQGLMILDEISSGDDYEVARLFVDRSVRHIEVPMVSSEWMEKVLGDHDVQLAGEGFGVVVGFVKGSDYQVLVEERMAHTRLKVLYFDSLGEATLERPADLAGFIIFNLPMDLQTLTLVKSGSNEVLTQVVYPSVEAVSVLHAEF